MKFTYEPETRPLDGYTIKRAIDRGGFGEVYYALSDSGKEVALKLLQRNAEIELRGITQCLNLKHPNLITLFDVKSDASGGQWLIMEYVSGKSLEHIISQSPQGLPLPDVEKWLTQLCAGAGYLHDRGIVHRDLKPANIFIENGIVKIGDVGLAKSMAPSQRSAHTESVGTVYYMAPEVSKGKYGHEIDVYSVGVMLYEMLTGHVPFSGESAGEILMKHLTEQPDLSKVPANFRGVLARVLNKDPLQRTPTAVDLAKEFSAALHGQAPAADVRFGNSPARPVSPVRSAAYVITDADLVSPRHAPPRKSDPYGQTMVERPYQRGYATPSQPQSGKWIAAIVVGAFVLMFVARGGSPGRIMSVIPMMGVVFCIGWAVVAIARSVTNSNRVAPAVAASRPRASAFATSPDTVRKLGLAHRMEDLAASMAKASIWGVTAAVVIALTSGLFGNPNNLAEEPAKLGLFALTTILASWTILLPTKLMWEGSEVPAGMRRFTMGALGACVGACGYYVHDSLFVDSMTARNNGTNSLVQEIGLQRLVEAGTLEPTLAGYVVFFAALFSLRRWWWRADSFRPSHFSLGSTLLTMFLAFLIPAVFVFPQDWGVAWAGAISCVVQLSSGFVPVKRRAPLLEVA